MQVKVKDTFKTRDINVLSSQIRQSIIERLKLAVYNLGRAKESRLAK